MWLHKPHTSKLCTLNLIFLNLKFLGRDAAHFLCGLFCKMVLPSIFAQFAEVGTRHSLTPAVEWLDSLIRPGGLLLVVSHLFSFMGGVRKK